MTNIMGNFTTIPINSSVVEYVFAFDNSLNNFPIFAMLIGASLVFAGGIFVWKRNFVDSFQFSLFVVSFAGFLMTLIRSEVFNDASGNPQRLLTFSKLTFFIVLIGLLALYKRIAER